MSHSAKQATGKTIKISVDIKGLKRNNVFFSLYIKRGLPRWLSGKESTCQCRSHRRHGLDPWVVKIPWWKWQPSQCSTWDDPMDRGVW